MLGRVEREGFSKSDTLVLDHGFELSRRLVTDNYLVLMKLCTLCVIQLDKL